MTMVLDLVLVSSSAYLSRRDVFLVRELQKLSLCVCVWSVFRMIERPPNADNALSGMTVEYLYVCVLYAPSGLFRYGLHTMLHTFFCF